jgi:tRNA A37 methylthiotransferase MiaB
MKTRTLKKNKVNVVTLGCSKNLVDSEVLMGQLKANKFDVEHESEDNDHQIVIINTCGFVENAKQESIDTILRYVDAKKNGEVEKVYVTGCLSERYKADLEKEIPLVDAYFGTRDLPKILKTLKEFGFIVNDLPVVVRNVDQLLEFYDNISSNRAKLQYEIDGLVYKVNQLNFQEKLSFY